MTSRVGRASLLALTLAAVVVAVSPGDAHHAILAKFDDKRPVTLTGIVTLVDWKNPHVHIFMNVKDAKGVLNWAIELESPIQLTQGGWTREDVQPGDAISVRGMQARNGSRQAWGETVTLTAGNKRVYFVTPAAPPTVLAARPAPRWPDKQPRLGPMPGGIQGYWAYPSSTVLIETGVNVAIGTDGLLKNPAADAAKVAPMQPWAQAVYLNRQTRFLQDDPTFINCKPPGGPRQFQLPEGVQFVEDRERQRIFVLMGGGNNNFRIIYTDGRGFAGQVGGDDDNPLYYGRSVGKWDGDTLAVETRGFNEDFWFTNGGLPHTDRLRLLERFSRPDYDTLRYDVTVDDTGAYTRSWSSGWTLRWVAGQEQPRHLCQENRP